VVLTPRRWRQVARGACRPDRVRQATSPRGDGGKRARSPRRARRTPLKPPRREGRMIRLYLWFCRVHFFCTRTMGASGHPAFPAPSCFKGARTSFKLRARGAARTRRHVGRAFMSATVIARSACDEAIQNLFRGPGLLCGACHRARVRATRWLAMTVMVMRTSPQIAIPCVSSDKL
jgi:hypothetical protein